MFSVIKSEILPSVLALPTV